MRKSSDGFVGGAVALGLFAAVACGGGDEFTAGSPDASAGAGGSGASGGSAGAAGGGSGATGGVGAAGGAGGAGGGAGGVVSGGAGGVVSGGAGGVFPGGAAGSISPGGAGGSVSCSNNDDDQYDSCSGDCDDNDPTVYPGAPEICGDGKANDCQSSTPDAGCQGIGTFVSTDVGDDANPGTQLAPVRSIGKGLANAQQIGPGTAVYVAGGHYSEKVVMVEEHDLLGGHECSLAACSWVRDPANNDTAILDQDAEGVLMGSSISRATRIDGFRIMGQNGAAAPGGRAAITVLGGAGVIENCTIYGPSVTSGDWQTGRSMGIRIVGPTRDPAGVSIEASMVMGGEGYSSSVGITSEAPTAQDRIQTYYQIRRNTVRGGRAQNASGAALWAGGAGVAVVDNDFEGGEANSPTGTAWGVIVASISMLDRNRINLQDGSRCVAGSYYWCGGLQSESATATIVNNVVRGAEAPSSAGVLLGEFEMPAGAIVFNSNTVDALGSSSGSSGGQVRAAALVVKIGDCTSCGFAGRVGQIRNNIFIAGSVLQRFGVYEEAPPSRSMHPLSLENNFFAMGSGTLQGGGHYRYYDGVAASVFGTIDQVNAIGQRVNGLPAGSNLDGDPMLDSDWHLQTGSPCIDTGTSTESPQMDHDPEPRPQGQGPDIGFDEYSGG